MSAQISQQVQEIAKENPKFKHFLQPLDRSAGRIASAKRRAKDAAELRQRERERAEQDRTSAEAVRKRLYDLRVQQWRAAHPGKQPSSAVSSKLWEASLAEAIGEADRATKELATAKAKAKVRAAAKIQKAKALDEANGVEQDGPSGGRTVARQPPSRAASKGGTQTQQPHASPMKGGEGRRRLVQDIQAAFQASEAAYLGHCRQNFQAFLIKAKAAKHTNVGGGQNKLLARLALQIPVRAYKETQTSHIATDTAELRTSVRASVAEVTSEVTSAEAVKGVERELEERFAEFETEQIRHCDSNCDILDNYMATLLQQQKRQKQEQEEEHETRARLQKLVLDKHIELLSQEIQQLRDDVIKAVTKAVAAGQ